MAALGHKYEVKQTAEFLQRASSTTSFGKFRWLMQLHNIEMQAMECCTCVCLGLPVWRVTGPFIDPYSSGGNIHNAFIAIKGTNVK